MATNVQVPPKKWQNPEKGFNHLRILSHNKVSFAQLDCLRWNV